MPGRRRRLPGPCARWREAGHAPRKRFAVLRHTFLSMAWLRKRKVKKARTPPLRPVHQSERLSHFNGKGRPLRSSSPSSERSGEEGEGSLLPGKGTPGGRFKVEARNREHPVPETAEAENAERGRGEFAEQREAVSPQYRLGYPQNDG